MTNNKQQHPKPKGILALTALAITAAGFAAGCGPSHEQISSEIKQLHQLYKMDQPPDLGPQWSSFSKRHIQDHRQFSQNKDLIFRVLSPADTNCTANQEQLNSILTGTASTSMMLVNMAINNPDEPSLKAELSKPTIEGQCVDSKLNGNARIEFSGNVFSTVDAPETPHIHKATTQHAIAVQIDANFQDGLIVDEYSMYIDRVRSNVVITPDGIVQDPRFQGMEEHSVSFTYGVVNDPARCVTFSYETTKYGTPPHLPILHTTAKAWREELNIFKEHSYIGPRLALESGKTKDGALHGKFISYDNGVAQQTTCYVNGEEFKTMNCSDVYTPSVGANE